MEWLRQVGRRLLMLFRRRQFDTELEEEMNLHRQLREQEEIDLGFRQKKLTTLRKDALATTYF